MKKEHEKTSCIIQPGFHIHTHPNIRSSCFFSVARAKKPWEWGCWLWVLMKQESMWKFVYQILFSMDLMVQTIWMCKSIVVLPHGEKKGSRLHLSKQCWENSKFWGEKKGFLERNCSMFQKMWERRHKQKMQAGGGHVLKMQEDLTKCGWLGRFVNMVMLLCSYS